MASLFKQREWYYVQFYNAHREPNRKRIPLKTRTRRKAKKLLRRLEDAYAEEAYDPWVDEWREDQKKDTVQTLSQDQVWIKSYNLYPKQAVLSVRAVGFSDGHSRKESKS